MLTIEVLWTLLRRVSILWAFVRTVVVVPVCLLGCILVWFTQRSVAFCSGRSGAHVLLTAILPLPLETCVGNVRGKRSVSSV